LNNSFLRNNPKNNNASKVESYLNIFFFILMILVLIPQSFGISIHEWAVFFHFNSFSVSSCNYNSGNNNSFDLYWIAIHQKQQGKGIGKILIKMAIEAITQMHGKNIWIETSSRAIYEPTRQFYLKSNCELIAELTDYYGPNDNKIIFLLKIK
jgi:GNAT superfamily N-acetyltransferase